MRVCPGVITGDATCQVIQPRPMPPLVLIFSPGQSMSGCGNALHCAVPDGRVTHTTRVFIRVEIDQLSAGGFVRIVLVLVLARCEERPRNVAADILSFIERRVAALPAGRDD